MFTSGLKDASDLREKMRRDLQRLKDAPLDADHAFDFFATAERMLDWVYYKKGGKAYRKAARKREFLLRVCSRLAKGRGHFDVQPSTVPLLAYPPSAASGAGRSLIVRLEGEAAVRLGATIGAIDLAERIMAYWDKHPLK